MEKKVYQCEVITPMFLAGGDGKTPEIRAPSIKGMMRFWWRAANAHLPLAELKKKEADIFGSSSEGEGKSKFTIVIENNKPTTNTTENFKPTKMDFTIKGIKPGSKFNIVLYWRKKIFGEIINDIATLAFLLGGVGKRSRRSFGSFCFKDKDLKTSFTSPDDVLGKIESILNSFYDSDSKPYKYEKKDKKIKITSDEYVKTEKYPYIKEVEIHKNGFDKWKVPVDIIKEAAHEYEYSEYLGSIQNKRFASPIYVSMVKIDNKYYPIITTLNTYFIDSDSNSLKGSFKDQEKFKNFIMNNGGK